MVKAMQQCVANQSSSDKRKKVSGLMMMATWNQRRKPSKSGEPRGVELVKNGGKGRALFKTPGSL